MQHIVVDHLLLPLLPHILLFKSWDASYCTHRNHKFPNMVSYHKELPPMHTSLNACFKQFLNIQYIKQLLIGKGRLTDAMSGPMVG